MAAGKARVIPPVILCGGTGKRLWPLSRTLYLKQFLPLTSEHTRLQQTVEWLGAGAFSVARFVEKPAAASAKRYLGEDDIVRLEDRYGRRSTDSPG